MGRGISWSVIFAAALSRELNWAPEITAPPPPMGYCSGRPNNWNWPRNFVIWNVMPSQKDPSPPPLSSVLLFWIAYSWLRHLNMAKWPLDIHTRSPQRGSNIHQHFAGQPDIPKKMFPNAPQNPPALPLPNGLFSIPSLPIPFPLPFIPTLPFPTFPSIFPQFPISAPPIQSPQINEESKNCANLKSEEESGLHQHCPFRLCTISPDSASQSSSISPRVSSSAPFRALLFDGSSPLLPGMQIQIPSNLRKFCHKTTNQAEANFCAKTGKIIRKVAKGEELVMLVGEKKKTANFGLTPEECAQIRANESSGDCSQGFSCHRCGKMFSYEYYRDKHLKFTPCVDNGLRRFPCALCPRSFEKRDRLRIHILHVHQNHRPHLCKICGKAFSQSSSLNKHLRTHSGERPYQCPHCPKAFTASSILRTHIRQHSGEKPFKCAQCGKCFASHAAHDSHIRRTHQSNE